MSAACVGDRFVITAAGELDVATAPLLRAVADRAREAEVPHVHLELAGLDVMDSTGLKVVLDLDREQRRCGGRLTITPGRASVQRVFAVCGLEPVLDFVRPDAEDRGVP